MMTRSLDHLPPGRMLARADEELQAKKDRGPLYGIPWGLKDIFAGCR
jgi:Asp-tRNA(Asn)/Glu-tRNA(Gln) amidotransferase A subunit family amidase